VEKLIAKTMEEEQPERKAAMVQGIANFMKMAYVQWNKDNVADEVILKNLRELSGGNLVLEENVNLQKVEFRPQPVRSNNNNRGRNNNNKGRQNNNGRPQQRNNPKQRH
jgi:hypothetical protein